VQLADAAGQGDKVTYSGLRLLVALAGALASTAALVRRVGKASKLFAERGNSVMSCVLALTVTTSGDDVTPTRRLSMGRTAPTRHGASSAFSTTTPAAGNASTRKRFL